jgi:hypothetical protein
VLCLVFFLFFYGVHIIYGEVRNDLSSIVSSRCNYLILIKFLLLKTQKLNREGSPFSIIARALPIWQSEEKTESETEKERGRKVTNQKE